MKIKWFSFIRVIGLLFVLTYHFFQSSFPGGFIGVDIFFTFSGYLITALMIDELAKEGTFKLKKFYLRRFYRIVPPVVLMVLLVLPFTYLVSKDYLADIGRQISGVLGFTTNYYEILSGGNYEAKFIPHLFIHTWSLAIEVHFYLIWGAIVYWLAKRQFSKIADDRRRMLKIRGSIFNLSFIFFFFSYLLCLFGSLLKLNPSLLYFSDLTHMFPFFVGSMVACGAGIKEQTKAFQKRSQEKLSYKLWLTLAIVLGGMLALGIGLKFDGTLTYRIGFLLTALLTGALIYSLRLLHEKTPNAKEPKVISILANISYGIYLFHWPLYVIFNQKMPNALAALLTTVLSIIFSLFSYYVVEPFLLGRKVAFLEKYAVMKKMFKPALVLGTLALIGVTVVRASGAPVITHLEENLWVNDVVQDQDALLAIKKTAIGDEKAEEPKETPEDSKEQTATTENKYDVPKGISIIGDSVTLGARAYLLQHIPDSEVDAEGNRTMDLAVKVMEQQIKNNTLREYVLICIGTNALDDYKEQTIKLIELLPKGHRLILMTPHNGKAKPTWNSSKLAVFERTLPSKYNFLTLADWNKIAPQHPEAFVNSDGTHFGGNEKGNEAYTKCLLDAVAEAKTKPVKGE